MLGTIAVVHNLKEVKFSLLQVFQVTQSMISDLQHRNLRVEGFWGQSAWFMEDRKKSRVTVPEMNQKGPLRVPKAIPNDSPRHILEHVFLI